MPRATESQLLNLVHLSSTVGELDERVSRHFGAEHIPADRLLAVRVNGARWVFESDSNPPSETYKTFRVIGRPSSLVLLASVFFGVVAFIWPPFILTLQDGGTWHMGFFYIFDGPGDTRRGAVNVWLLLLELVVIAAVGSALYLIAQRIERRNVYYEL